MNSFSLTQVCPALYALCEAADEGSRDVWRRDRDLESVSFRKRGRLETIKTVKERGDGRWARDEFRDLGIYYVSRGRGGNKDGLGMRNWSLRRLLFVGQAKSSTKRIRQGLKKKQESCHMYMAIREDLTSDSRRPILRSPGVASCFSPLLEVSHQERPDQPRPFCPRRRRAKQKARGNGRQV